MGAACPDDLDALYSRQYVLERGGVVCGVCPSVGASRHIHALDRADRGGYGLWEGIESTMVLIMIFI